MLYSNLQPKRRHEWCSASFSKIRILSFSGLHDNGLIFNKVINELGQCLILLYSKFGDEFINYLERTYLPTLDLGTQLTQVKTLEMLVSNLVKKLALPLFNRLKSTSEQEREISIDIYKYFPNSICPHWGMLFASRLLFKNELKGFKLYIIPKMLQIWVPFFSFSDFPFTRELLSKFASIYSYCVIE